MEHVDVNKLQRFHVLSYYLISYVRSFNSKFSAKIKYGQRHYNFDQGGLLFASPGQIIGTHENEEDHPGYALLIHPDFLRGYPLASTIKKYGFFSYSVNEALHLSDKEEGIVKAIFENIEKELNGSADDLSQDIIISQVELLLNYANRYYRRQFLTREAVQDDLLQNLEDLLEDYFANERSLGKGIPTVKYLSQQLKISPHHLSDTLRSLTGQNAQQHIHNKVIEKAKELLSATPLTVSEIAFRLGFEHSQSFSKLFKSKTKLSPVAFRQSFN
ncbi:MAG TPA: helix-turn-helix transcriptional regulator [Chryseolinea sp.]|nr:helix-turn-helix transcriptional regulator [Chryseolinea sp.]